MVMIYAARGFVKSPISTAKYVLYVILLAGSVKNRAKTFLFFIMLRCIVILQNYTKKNVAEECMEIIFAGYEKSHSIEWLFL